MGSVQAVPAKYCELFNVNVTANELPVKPSDAKSNLASPHPDCVPNDGVYMKFNTFLASYTNRRD